jgi:hypothetical protein
MAMTGQPDIGAIPLARQAGTGVSRLCAIVAAISRC